MDKKNVTLDVDSATALMQEVYNDIVEQKNHASLIMKKMLNFMKTAEDMSIIGPVIKDQQKILTLCTDKKLSLVKLQKEFLKQLSDAGGKGPAGKLTLTDEDRELLDKLVNDKDDNDRDIDSYKLK